MGPVPSSLCPSTQCWEDSGPLLFLEQHSLLPLLSQPPSARGASNKLGCLRSFQEIPEPRHLPGTQAQGPADPLVPPMEGLLGEGGCAQEGGATPEHQPAQLSGSLPGQQAGQDGAPAQVTQAVERTCSGSGPGTAFHSLHQDLGLLIPTLHTVVLQAGPPGHSL